MSRESEILLERVTTAWRPKSRDGSLAFHPAWHDLTENERVAAFDITEGLRTLEAALDAEGLSSTAQAVLSKIRGSGI